MSDLFNLPEITDQIASYLTNKSLFQSIQVSKYWYRLFISGLYSKVTLIRADSMTTEYLDRLTIHASSIQGLTLKNLVDESTTRLLILPLPRLQHLRLVLSRGTTNTVIVAVQNLVRRQGHVLKTISFQAHSRYASIMPLNNVLWSILAGCHRYLGRLRTLRLSQINIILHILTEDIKQIFRLLNSFSIHDVRLMRAKGTPGDSISSSSSLAPSPSSTWGLNTGNNTCRIRDLTIRACSAERASVQDEYTLILDCQELRSLKWNHWSRAYTKPRLAQDLHSGAWPFLESLHLQWTSISDEDLAEILLALGPKRSLRELNADYTGFGPLCAKALMWRGEEANEDHVQDNILHRHRLALQELFLVGSHNTTGSMLHEFLCTFPNLKQFSGAAITDKDILANPRPWVCTGLQMLDMAPRLEIQEPDSSQSLNSNENPTSNPVQFEEGTSAAAIITAPENITGEPSTITITAEAASLPAATYRSSAHIFWDRLASLTHLEELYTMDSWRADQNRFHSLHFQVDWGLDKLKSLRRMRQVTWGDQRHHVRIQDAQWMVENWPHLERVRIHNQARVEKDAAQLFKSQGIQWRDMWEAE
ncbi:hypothetical protein BGZ83_000827 [Gryganskiella cystojenkinii]|nr:hypothetical protein BGZ83_000827 [Gryganskiella cystojenkinii]